MDDKRYLRNIIALAVVIAAGCGGDIERAGDGPDATSALADLATTTPADAGADLAVATCLLRYNEAPLTLSDHQKAIGSQCCYAQGGKNTCDTHATCGGEAGEGCCIVYATSATAVGTKCCAYENGAPLDTEDQAACSMLLGAGH